MTRTSDGRPRPMLSATTDSRKGRARRGTSKTMVRETSTWRMDSSTNNQLFAVGGAERHWYDFGPALEKQLEMCGAEAVTDGLELARGLARGEAIGQFCEAQPGLGGLALGPFVPVSP